MGVGVGVGLCNCGVNAGMGVALMLLVLLVVVNLFVVLIEEEVPTELVLIEKLLEEVELLKKLYYLQAQRLEVVLIDLGVHQLYSD